MTYKNKTLFDIKFPVFPIKPYVRLWTEHNITYVDTGKVERILDNKNLPGNFGRRRARIPIKQIYTLEALPTIKSLIKYRSLTYLYVDMEGELFTYKKSRYCKLVHKEILKVEKREKVGYIVWVDGIDHPYTIPVLLYDPFIKYARILLTDFGPILYDYTKIRGKDSRRMI